MSKSSGEFLTVSLLEEKGYDPLSYRFFCLQSHYRKSLVFTWENLDNAQGAYRKLIARIAGLNPDSGEAVDQAVFDELTGRFKAAMDNDLNTSLAVTALYDVLKAKTNDATKLALIADYDQVLGLCLIEKADAKREELKKAEAAKASSAAGAGGFSIVSESGEEDADVTAKIEARRAAKKAKDFAQADQIREELRSMGIELTDLPGGVMWKRV